MPPKKAAANNKPYSKASPISNGEILTDLANQKWKVGKAIGSGGFGDIYLASEDVAKAVTDKANYVVKIEPHSNGPLFVEIAFYIRTAKLLMIEEWKQQNKIESLGMPHYVASGSHETNSQRFRFLVLPRYGQDLYKVISEKPGKRFHHKTIFAIALQIMDIYEYIHSKEFVHADVKASNLALELHPSSKKKQQVYLLDFGLALKYVDSNGQHYKYAPDARKAHNGTLEYAARDAHIGAFGRRGDLEVLAYNMLEWLTGKLPWTRDATADVVHRQKQAFMSDVNLKKIYPTEIPGLDIVEKFLKYVAKLEFEDKPNYSHCRDMLRKGLPSSPKGSLFLDELANGLTTVKNKKTTTKRRSTDLVDDNSNKKICVVPSEFEEPNPKRSTRTTKKVKDFNWARLLSTDPEKLVRAASSLSQQTDGSKDDVNGSSKPPSPVIPENPTPAMLQILSKKKENIRSSPIKPKGVQPLQPEGTNELTPAMKEVMMRKKKVAAVSALKTKKKPATVTGASKTTTVTPTFTPTSTRTRRNNKQ